jgi:hypothetical protein
MRQRDSGEGFVSRTRLFHTQAGESIEVLRAVLANPLTTEADIQAVLAEQVQLGAQLEQEAAGLFDLFAERVLCSPQSIALYEGEQAISFARLAEKVSRISHQLRRAQIKPGTILGLAAERSEAYMAGMLAIIQVGGCFMPLDPNYPAERLRALSPFNGAARLVPLAACCDLLASTAGVGLGLVAAGASGGEGEVVAARAWGLLGAADTAVLVASGDAAVLAGADVAACGLLASTSAVVSLLLGATVASGAGRPCAFGDSAQARPVQRQRIRPRKRLLVFGRWRSNAEHFF